MTAPAGAPTRLERALAWCMRIAHSRGAVPATFAWNVAQASVVPGPADALFLPLAIADPRIALRLALTVLVGGTIGSTLAWALGGGAIELLPASVGNWIADGAWLASAREQMRSKGWLFLVLSPVTPLSSKLIAYGAGAVGMSWWQLIVPLTAGRLVRYVVLVVLLRRGLGDEALKLFRIDRDKLARAD